MIRPIRRGRSAILVGMRPVLLVCGALVLAACRDATAPTNSGPPNSGDALLARLRALPGVTVTEIPAHYGYPRQFALDMTQPVNHDNPSGATFTQRAYLSHADERAPMVFGAYGYGATRPRGCS